MVKLEPGERQQIKSAALIVGLRPSVFARTTVLQKAMEILKQNSELNNSLREV